MFFDIYLQEVEIWAQSGAFTQNLEPVCVNIVQKCLDFLSWLDVDVTHVLRFKMMLDLKDFCHHTLQI